MLDRAKLMRELQKIEDQLFLDCSNANRHAQDIFKQISQDPTFPFKINEIRNKSPWPLPSWQGKLDQSILISPQIDNYTAFSVDGSQIYPDRHQGIACFLINIGSIVLRYGMPGKPVVCNSEPYIFVGDEAYAEKIQPYEFVNCKRQELELQAGLLLSRMIKDDVKIPLVLLFDGSLIFWHLETKSSDMGSHFLDTYLAILFELYKERIPIAGYISLPKSKELVNLIMMYVCDFDIKRAECYKEFDRVIDTVIMYSFLKPFSRSIVFKNHASVSKQYPDAVCPYFFYLHVGNEIGRVEIPAWIAQDDKMVDQIARVIIDQSIKGRGYPVVLAEAHEQAVVKGPDRDFFYHLLHKFGFEQNKQFRMSQKVIKKRGIGI